VINYQSPIQKLSGSIPDYSQLHVFGCACWPNLTPYNTWKVAFRSHRCVFLAYSNLHKGYKCLDVASGCVYISRDVDFNETIFPFLELNPNAGAQLRYDITLIHPTLIPHSPTETVVENNINNLHNPVENHVEFNDEEGISS
jgi:hypothetical protein